MYKINKPTGNGYWPTKGALRLALQIGLFLGNIAPTTPSKSIQTAASIKRTISKYKDEIATQLKTGGALPKNIGADKKEVLMKFIDYKNGRFDIQNQTIDMSKTQEQHITDQFFINARFINIPKNVMFSNCVFLGCQFEDTQNIALLNCDIRGSSFKNSIIDFSKFHGINAEGANFGNTTIIFDPYKDEQYKVPMYFIEKGRTNTFRSFSRQQPSIYTGASFVGAKIDHNDDLTRRNSMLGLNLAGAVIIDEQKKPITTIPMPAGNSNQLNAVLQETNQIYTRFGLPTLESCPPNKPWINTYEPMEANRAYDYIKSVEKTVESVFEKIPTKEKKPKICIKQPIKLLLNQSALVYDPNVIEMNAFVWKLHGQTIDGILNRGPWEITFMTPIENPNQTFAYFGSTTSLSDVFNHELLHVLGVPHPNFNPMYQQQTSNLPPRLLSIMVYLYNGGFPIKMGFGPMDVGALSDIFNLSPPDNMILSLEGMDPNITQRLNGQPFMHSPDCGTMEVSNDACKLKLSNISECLNKKIDLRNLTAELFLLTLTGESRLREKTMINSKKTSMIEFEPIESHHFIFPSIKRDLKRALSPIADQINVFLFHSYFDYSPTKDFYEIKKTFQTLDLLIKHIENQCKFFYEQNAVTDLFIELNINDDWYKIIMHFNPYIIEEQKKRNDILNITFEKLYQLNNFKTLEKALGIHKITPQKSTSTSPPASNTSPQASNPTPSPVSNTSPPAFNPTSPPASNTSPQASNPTTPPPDSNPPLQTNATPPASNPTTPPTSNTSPQASNPTTPPASNPTHQTNGTSPPPSDPTHQIDATSPPPSDPTHQIDATSPPPSDPTKSNTTFIILMSSFIGGGSLILGLTLIFIYCRNIKKNPSDEGTEMA